MAWTHPLSPTSPTQSKPTCVQSWQPEELPRPSPSEQLAMPGLHTGLVAMPAARTGTWEPDRGTACRSGPKKAETPTHPDPLAGFPSAGTGMAAQGRPSSPGQSSTPHCTTCTPPETLPLVQGQCTQCPARGARYLLWDGQMPGGQRFMLNMYTAASAVLKSRQKHRKEQTATAEAALPS